MTGPTVFTALVLLAAGCIQFTPDGPAPEPGPPTGEPSYGPLGWVDHDCQQEAGEVSRTAVVAYLDWSGTLHAFHPFDASRGAREVGPGFVRAAATRDVLLTVQDGPEWQLAVRDATLAVRAERAVEGPVTALAVQDGLVVTASGWRIDTYDLALQHLGTLVVPGTSPQGYVHAIGLAGSDAFLVDVAVTSEYLAFRADVSDPTAPRLLHTHDISQPYGNKPDLHWVDDVGTWYIERNAAGPGSGWQTLHAFRPDGTEGTRPVVWSESTATGKHVATGRKVIESGFALPAWSLTEGRPGADVSLVRIGIAGPQLAASCAVEVPLDGPAPCGSVPRPESCLAQGEGWLATWSPGFTRTNVTLWSGAPPVAEGTWPLRYGVRDLWILATET